jgi:hypothetical protein
MHQMSSVMPVTGVTVFSVCVDISLNINNKDLDHLIPILDRYGTKKSDQLNG